MRLGIPIIVRDEQELLSWCLEGLTTIRDFISVVSIVDNGSIDATPYIIERYKDRLPIVIQFEAGHHHHGNLRNLALEGCRSNCDWILYVDSDETFTSNMARWLASGEIEKADIWDFMKYSTILDHLHHVQSGAGPTTRLFRNVPGVHYVEPVHTKPEGIGLNKKVCNQNVYFFDHTGLKSTRSLWAKGWRYQEHRGEVGIGAPHQYIGRVQTALAQAGCISELPPEVKNAGIVDPPILDASLYAILASVIPAPHPCWLKG
jgi:glycosyltransferase involved in cell wall biosynthesis